MPAAAAAECRRTQQVKRQDFLVQSPQHAHEQQHTWLFVFIIACLDERVRCNGVRHERRLVQARDEGEHVREPSRCAAAVRCVSGTARDSRRPTACCMCLMSHTSHHASLQPVIASKLRLYRSSGMAGTQSSRPWPSLLSVFMRTIEPCTVRMLMLPAWACQQIRVGLGEHCYNRSFTLLLLAATNRHRRACVSGP